MKPNIETYINSLKENFGENLTPQVENVAADFIENYEEYQKMFLENKILIISSTNRLADATNNTEYSAYRTYYGLAILLVAISLVFCLISWKISIVLFSLAIIMKIISKLKRDRSSKNYTELIYDELRNDVDRGLLKVCINYCAGVIQLQSSKGNAHIPILPSTCITGKIVYAKHNR